MANLQEVMKNVLWHSHEFENAMRAAIENTHDNGDWDKLLSIVNKTEEVMQQSKLEIQKRYPPSRPPSMQLSSSRSTTSGYSSASHTSFNTNYAAPPPPPLPVNPPVNLSRGFEPPNNNSAGSNRSDHRKENATPRNQSQRPHANPKNDAKKAFMGDNGPLDKSRSQLDPLRIFLPTIAPITTDNNLRSAFAPYGKIREARAFRNPDGSPAGKGIVWFESQETVTQLLHKTFVVDGAEVKVSPFYVKSKPDKPTTTTTTGQQSSRMTETLTETSSSRKIDTSAGKQTGNKSGGGGDTSDKCMICKSSKANCNLLWCGHVVVCSGCGGKLKVCPKPGCGQAIEKVQLL
ncbi:hypothetical protein BV898_18345 [Hypsibius exemplaris]|uniref:RRM domain-containing protein n=1 Tax=Hypsibius exemplaris TaxID=2072580 RepID=A0A9X6NNZ1_HYPEX|nr:hypothetical protein BV898_18345 [Hypsibius exemplaris]